MERCAYVTFLSSDSYLPGALVLAASLKDSETLHKLVVLVAHDTVSVPAVQLLYGAFDYVIFVQSIFSKDLGNLALLGRPELDITFTKLHVWGNEKLIELFDRVAFFDADTLVLRNVDSIFSYLDPVPVILPDGSITKQDVYFAAAPDIGWPDCFNSGVFVTRPSKGLNSQLLEHAHTAGSFDGGDQGLLNSFFKSWSSGRSVPGSNEPLSTRLPFLFNVTPSASYSYLPAFVHYNVEISVVHFIGQSKPWLWDRFTDGDVIPRGDTSAQTLNLIRQWWNVFDGNNIANSLTIVKSLEHFQAGWNRRRPIYSVSKGPPTPPAEVSKHGSGSSHSTYHFQHGYSHPSTFGESNSTHYDHRFHGVSQAIPGGPPMAEFGTYRADWDMDELIGKRRSKSLRRDMSGTRLNKLSIDADASLIKKYGYVTDDETPATPSQQRKKSGSVSSTGSGGSTYTASSSKVTVDAGNTTASSEVATSVSFATSHKEIRKMSSQEAMVQTQRSFLSDHQKQIATGSGNASGRTTTGSSTAVTGIEVKTNKEGMSTLIDSTTTKGSVSTTAAGTKVTNTQSTNSHSTPHNQTNMTSTSSTGTSSSNDAHNSTRLVTKTTLIPTTVTTKTTKTTKTITEDDPALGKQVKTIITTKKTRMKKIGEKEVELLGSTTITEVFVKRGEDGENVKVSETVEEEEVALEG
ncbi:nucleotide-diphospho-sugar transferase [Cladochytrium replicatum]|nr:nucleotide-diphospho-sugar transferase [Cladochytrium replicatum]